MHTSRKLALAAATACLGVSGVVAAGGAPAAMMRGDTAATSNGWQTRPAFTVGSDVNGYLPPGILDGLGIYDMPGYTVRVLASHELGNTVGYPYALANGTVLSGARVSFFDFNRFTKRLINAGPAYDAVYDRAGNLVTDPAQVGGATGIEASLWALDPTTGSSTRIAEVDRSAVAPADATDSNPADIGNWESSGVIDVTSYFRTPPGKTLLLGTVQAHSVTDGSIADNGLVEGGQLLFFRGNAQ